MTAPVKSIFILGFPFSLFLSLFFAFTQQRDTGWTSVSCHGYWKGNVSRDQEGKAKPAVTPPPRLSSWLQRKSSLLRHNRRLKEVGVATRGIAGVKV